jgi:transmembrane 9 superfamily protein 2/4
VSKKGEFDPATVSTCSSDSQAPKWDDTLLLNMKNDKGMEVVYSYGVEWISSPTSWATRWDIYLSMNGQTHDDIHWLSITNSILVAVFLTALVALILVSFW